MIGQSEGKIKPHREDRLSGPESVQKHVRSSEELRNYSLISAKLALKTCLVKQSCDRYYISSYFPSDRVEIRPRSSSRFRQVCLASQPLSLCANWSTRITHAIFSSCSERYNVNLDCTDVESNSHTHKLVDRRFVPSDFL